MSKRVTLEFVLAVLDAFALNTSDSCGSVFWRTDGEYAPLTFLANCSDCFWWATADCEEVTPENLPILQQSFKDCAGASPSMGTVYATELFAARVRKMRPQRASYESYKKSTGDESLWPLFDACGPERDKVSQDKPAPAGEGVCRKWFDKICRSASYFSRYGDHCYCGLREGHEGEHVCIMCGWVENEPKRRDLSITTDELKQPASPPPSGPQVSSQVSSGDTHAERRQPLGDRPARSGDGNQEASRQAGDAAASNQSGPLESNTIATADLPLTMPDAFGDNRFHDLPLTRVAPSARPAEPRVQALNEAIALLEAAEASGEGYSSLRLLRELRDQTKPAAPSRTGGEEKMTTERKVACENAEGTLNIHAESTTCEVCRASAPDAKVCDLRNGDVQCPAYFNQGDSALRCEFVMGHNRPHRTYSGTEWKCAHANRSGGNDYIQCIDCGETWDYRKPAPSAPASAARKFLAEWNKGHMESWRSSSADEWIVEVMDAHAAEQTRQLREELTWYKNHCVAYITDAGTTDLRPQLYESERLRKLSNERAQAAEAERDELLHEREAQTAKRQTILLDDHCVETIKGLSAEGGEEISFGGVMGGVKLKWQELDRLRKEAK